MALEACIAAGSRAGDALITGVHRAVATSGPYNKVPCDLVQVGGLIRSRDTRTGTTVATDFEFVDEYINNLYDIIIYIDESSINCTVFSKVFPRIEV
ncbi:hypothetical protein BDR03DRAFT_941370 [Suillus americanus]|nr:hypothetical protein BDR03DRAFT_941370 [Suillus americanus]